MRKLLALLVLGLVALAAGASFAVANDEQGNEPVQKLVFGGGRIPAGSCTDGSTSFCTSVTREFSIYAVSHPQDGGTYGNIITGNVEHGGVTNLVRVTCLAVSGNVAEIGGVIVQAADSSTVGGSFRLFVRDSGQPGTVARDGVSPSFVDPPPAKPTCGDVATNAFGNGYLTLAYGDLVVRAG
jgi:hypothetical protein